MTDSLTPERVRQLLHGAVDSIEAVAPPVDDLLDRHRGRRSNITGLLAVAAAVVLVAAIAVVASVLAAGSRPHTAASPGTTVQLSSRPATSAPPPPVPTTPPVSRHTTPPSVRTSSHPLRTGPATACSAAALHVATTFGFGGTHSYTTMFRLENTGPTCQLSGYPDVAIEQGDGTPMALRISRWQAATPADVASIQTYVNRSYLVAIPSQQRVDLGHGDHAWLLIEDQTHGDCDLTFNGTNLTVRLAGAGMRGSLVLTGVHIDICNDSIVKIAPVLLPGPYDYPQNQLDVPGQHPA